MTRLVASLWAGELSLGRAFWEFVVLYGLALNLVATLGYFALLANDAPLALTYLAFFLPLPYDVLVLVGVWRSAAHYEGPPLWADLARGAMVLWFLIETLA